MVSFEQIFSHFYFKFLPVCHTAENFLKENYFQTTDMSICYEKMKTISIFIVNLEGRALSFTKVGMPPHKTENLSFSKISQLCALSMSIQFIEILYHPHSRMLLVVVFENLYLILKNIDLHILTLSRVQFVFKVLDKISTFFCRMIGHNRIPGNTAQINPEIHSAGAAAY